MTATFNPAKLRPTLAACQIVRGDITYSVGIFTSVFADQDILVQLTDANSTPTAALTSDASENGFPTI